MATRHNPWIEPKVPIPASLKHLPLRRVYVHGELWGIPQHVSRLEQPSVNHFGWQVRYKGTYRFVGEKGCAESSLIEAIAYLAQLIEGAKNAG